jgi:hypothetical protein
MVRSLAALLLVVAAASLALAFPEGADPGHVGLPDQPDCGSCHYLGAPPDDHSGLVFESLPEVVMAGSEVEFVLRLRDPAARIGGFQMTADAVNQAAGQFLAGQNQRIDAFDGRYYLGHSSPRPSRAANSDDGRVVEWMVRWQAPPRPGKVSLIAAAVAANDDASALGDNAYRHEQTIEVIKCKAD